MYYLFFSILAILLAMAIAYYLRSRPLFLLMLVLLLTLVSILYLSSKISYLLIPVVLLLIAAVSFFLKIKAAFFWTLALLLTLASAVYQRMTGPTYPLRGKVALCGQEVRYRLARSAENNSFHQVTIRVPEKANISGIVRYMRFKKGDPWKPEKTVEMTPEVQPPQASHGSSGPKKPGEAAPGEKIRVLTAPLAWLPEGGLPPKAGKLAYTVTLSCGQEQKDLAGGRPVIIRFKGPVPDWILIPHIVIMFLAMLTAVRGGLEAPLPEGRTRLYAFSTVVLLFIGGFVLGSLIQKFSFGSWWTGFPLGFDLTDNKMLIAFLGWLVALVAGRKGRGGRWWVLGAAVLLLVVYLIPHSLLGSELDYTKVAP